MILRSFVYIYVRIYDSGTRMRCIRFSSKTGVTEWYQSNADYRT
jgi:hypothetical protein